MFYRINNCSEANELSLNVRAQASMRGTVRQNQESKDS